MPSWRGQVTVNHPHRNTAGSIPASPTICTFGESRHAPGMGWISDQYP